MNELIPIDYIIPTVSGKDFCSNLRETNDERFGTVNSYPITAWEDFLEVHQ